MYKKNKTGWYNVGSVRFELTIDGSLRNASVLQRIITLSEDPIVHHLHHAKTAGARRHAGLGHDPGSFYYVYVCSI